MDDKEQKEISLQKFIFLFDKNIISILKKFNKNYHKEIYYLSYDKNWAKIINNKFFDDFDKKELFYKIKLDNYRFFLLTEYEIDSIINSDNNIVLESAFIDSRIHSDNISKNGTNYESSKCNLIIIKKTEITINFDLATEFDLDYIKYLSILDQSFSFKKFIKKDSKIFIKKSNRGYYIKGNSTFMKENPFKF